ncbi:hypothetical protein BN946_scf184645.g1 [Trametes cinnabarina]|uniref:Secreted protein n=1 Tax=Pycnoporus cinnabarinus TaxID=5643 RepID=A0A060SIZ2_PYCCI|nr:hypothetical protein BN946_scf184645.g1 [Trametes cinnabarina]
MSFRKVIAIATVVAGLQMAGTSAQSISSQCQSTLASLVGNSDASCLNPQALVGLVVASSSSSNSSIVPTINSWLTGLCSRPACTNDTLASVVQSVTSGCSSELTSLGLSNVDAGELTTLVQMAYPTARQVACLGDTSNNNALCVTETLNNIQPYTGTLTVSNIDSIASQVMSGSLPNLPSNVTCTDCTKAAYNIVQQNFGDLTSGFSGDVNSTCGASFTDGSQPSSVTQLASDSTQSASQSGTANAASGLSAPIGFGSLVGLVASSLLTAASAIFVLA